MEGPVGNPGYIRSVWQDVTTLADAHNAPGSFTAFAGYEWTQLFFMAHRVVIFKDSIDKTHQVVPFSQYDGNDPEALWSYMADYEKTTGGEVLAIPHNGNLSSGIMFALEDAKGNPLSNDYARARSRWEPLFEVTQYKGDSETHPLLSSTDEFADYETWTRDIPIYYDEAEAKKRSYTDFNHWNDKNRRGDDARWMRPYEYARSALKLGLGEQGKIGVNPF